VKVDGGIPPGPVRLAILVSCAIQGVLDWPPRWLLGDAKVYKSSLGSEARLKSESRGSRA
jgi:hypothetical protein